MKSSLPVVTSVTIPTRELTVICDMLIYGQRDSWSERVNPTGPRTARPTTRPRSRRPKTCELISNNINHLHYFVSDVIISTTLNNHTRMADFCGFPSPGACMTIRSMPSAWPSASSSRPI
jgi:hypothetical protein